MRRSSRGEDQSSLLGNHSGVRRSCCARSRSGGSVRPDPTICPDSASHIQAVGTTLRANASAAGQRKYRHDDEWRRRRNREKNDRVLTLGLRLADLATDVPARLERFSEGRTLLPALRRLGHPPAVIRPRCPSLPTTPPAPRSSAQWLAAAVLTDARLVSPHARRVSGRGRLARGRPREDDMAGTLGEADLDPGD